MPDEFHRRGAKQCATTIAANLSGPNGATQKENQHYICSEKDHVLIMHVHTPGTSQELVYVRRLDRAYTRNTTRNQGSGERRSSCILLYRDLVN